MKIKMTDKNGMTKGGMQWGEEITHSVPYTGELCSSGILHYYEDEFVAVFMAPAHGHSDGIAWECKTSEPYAEDGTKSGCGTITTIGIVELPLITMNQRVEIAILIIQKYCQTSEEWEKWAAKWLSGEDRTAEAAWAAWAACSAEAKAADAAACSAEAKAWAAEAAAWAADAAWADAAKAAAWAANAAKWAKWSVCSAEAACSAVDAAKWAATEAIDLTGIIRRVIVKSQ